MAHQADYFDAPRLDENAICLMQWDGETLTYALAPTRKMMGGQEPDFQVIGEESGITTDSLFRADRYQSLKITENMFR